MRLVVWCDVPPGECVMDLSEEELRTWTLRTLCRKAKLIPEREDVATRDVILAKFGKLPVACDNLEATVASLGVEPNSRFLLFASVAAAPVAAAPAEEDKRFDEPKPLGPFKGLSLRDALDSFVRGAATVAEMNLLRSEAARVVSHPAFLELEATHVEKLLSDAHLNAEEVVLLRRLVAWASRHAEAAGEPANVEQRRVALLRELIPTIRLNYLSATQLAAEVVPLKVLDPHVLAALFTHAVKPELPPPHPFVMQMRDARVPEPLFRLQRVGQGMNLVISPDMLSVHKANNDSAFVYSDEVFSQAVLSFRLRIEISDRSQQSYLAVGVVPGAFPIANQVLSSNPLVLAAGHGVELINGVVLVDGVAAGPMRDLICADRDEYVFTLDLREGALRAQRGARDVTKLCDLRSGAVRPVIVMAGGVTLHLSFDCE